jgi:hypothetical protein
MQNYPGPALVTLATSLLLFVCAAYVGRCRIRFAIKAPATSGHPQFEIAYRIQMNTLENAVLFLPVLWVFARQPVEPLGDRARCPVAGGQDLVRPGLRARSEDAGQRLPALDARFRRPRARWRLGSSARTDRLNADTAGEQAVIAPVQADSGSVPRQAPARKLRPLRALLPYVGATAGRSRWPCCSCSSPRGRRWRCRKR